MPAYSLCLELLYGRTGGVEVINAGVPGYSSSQGLEWLRTELLDYDPELVIVYFGWNDHWIARPAPDDRYMKSLERSPLRLARLAGAAARTVSGGEKGGGGKSLRVPIERYRDNLREIDRLARARGAKCLFLTAPAVYGEETREELIAAGHIDETTDYESLHRRYNDVVRAMADEGAAVLDLAAAFEQSDDPASLMRDDGIHLDDAGIGFVAAALRDCIETNGLLE
jgi:lysophospholipase L1-like esterase